MTNKEKFKEVFGFTPQFGSKGTYYPCPLPIKVCTEEVCSGCPFYGWWHKEYKPCFKLKENLDGE